MEQSALVPNGFEQLENILYPDGFKHWTGSIEHIPEEKTSIVINNTTIYLQRVKNEVHFGCELAIVPRELYVEIQRESYEPDEVEDIYIPILKLTNESFLKMDTMNPPSKYDVEAGWNVYINDKVYKKVALNDKSIESKIERTQGDMFNLRNIKIKAYTFIFQPLLKKENYEFPLNNNSDVISIYFTLENYEATTPFFIITLGEIKEAKKKRHNTVFGPIYTFRHNEFECTLESNQEEEKEQEWSNFELNIQYIGNITLQESNYWNTEIVPLFQTFMKVKNVNVLVRNVYPIEIAQRFANAISYIVNAFHPHRENTVQMLLYKKNGTLIYRTEVDKGSPVMNTEIDELLSWRTESPSLRLETYLQMENRFKALANRVFVKLSDAEMDEMQMLLEKLKQARTTKFIERRIVE